MVRHTEWQFKRPRACPLVGEQQDPADSIGNTEHTRADQKGRQTTILGASPLATQHHHSCGRRKHRLGPRATRIAPSRPARRRSPSPPVPSRGSAACREILIHTDRHCHILSTGPVPIAARPPPTQMGCAYPQRGPCALFLAPPGPRGGAVRGRAVRVLMIHLCRWPQRGISHQNADRSFSLRQKWRFSF